MKDCNPVSSPADYNQILLKTMCPKDQKTKDHMSTIPYREAVGSLIFAAQTTRPDLCFAVNNVAKFSQNPGPAHWLAVKRIFRYIKGTIDVKLTLSKGNSESIFGAKISLTVEVNSE